MEAEAFAAEVNFHFPRRNDPRRGKKYRSFENGYPGLDDCLIARATYSHCNRRPDRCSGVEALGWSPLSRGGNRTPHGALCATVSKSALRRFGCGEQGRSFFRLRVQPVAQGWANHMLKRSRQYSSASMIVITRLVTDGSAGSGEW